MRCSRGYPVSIANAASSLNVIIMKNNRMCSKDDRVLYSSGQLYDVSVACLGCIFAGNKDDRCVADEHYSK